MDFYEIFPVILTDNGGEFARVDDIEMDVRGESKLFFRPKSFHSDQKGRIEKNHTLIRDILPKGTSFDNLTQDDINLVLFACQQRQTGVFQRKIGFMNSLHLPTVRNWQHFWVSLKLTLRTSSNHHDY